jgi:hypothetical protein
MKINQWGEIFDFTFKLSVNSTFSTLDRVYSTCYEINASKTIVRSDLSVQARLYPTFQSFGRLFFNLRALFNLIFQFSIPIAIKKQSQKSGLNV